MSNSWLMQVSADVLAILIPAIVGLGFELLRRKLGTATYDKLLAQLKYKKGLAWTAVTFVEQASKAAGNQMSSKEKFDKAAEWLSKEAKLAGIPLTEDQIEALIEAAVGMLNCAVQDELDKSNSS